MSGFGTEHQILEALKRYLARPQYIQKTLYYLFKMTTGNYEPKIDMNLPRVDIIFVSINTSHRIIKHRFYLTSESSLLRKRIPHRVSNPNGRYGLSVQFVKIRFGSKNSSQDPQRNCQRYFQWLNL